MNAYNIRWIQRFKHFKQAFAQLEKGVHLSVARPLTALEEQGLIQAFEFTHELAWNVLKDFLEERGVFNLYGSKDTTREAYKRGLLEDGDVWMDMIKSRNLSSHTYNPGIAESIRRAIVENYHAAFKQMSEKLGSLAENGQS